MGMCESCEHRDNPIGYCCDTEYKGVRDNRGNIVSRKIPQIICGRLKKVIPSEWKKDNKKEVPLADGATKNVTAVHKIKYYVNPDEKKQENNYRKFEIIATKRVSPHEEADILKRLNADYWDEVTGISRRLEAGWGVPQYFKSEVYKVYQRILSAQEVNTQEDTLTRLQEEKRAVDQFIKEVISILTPKQFVVFKNEYDKSMKKVEVAKALRCSKQNITNLLNSAQAALQRL
jgi:hypothetical protein